MVAWLRLLRPLRGGDFPAGKLCSVHGAGGRGVPGPMEWVVSLPTPDRKPQLGEVKPPAKIPSWQAAVLSLGPTCLTPAKLSLLSRRTLPLVQVPTALSAGPHREGA